MRHPNLITEADVRAAMRDGIREIVAGPRTVITPLARDAARASGVRLSASEPSGESDSACGCNPRKEGSGGVGISSTGIVLAIGSDHGGYEMKEEIKRLLVDSRQEVFDVGTHSTAKCDYPDFAFAVARAVAGGRATLGIMIDGAGPGSAMVCNKVPGIRAACVHDEFTAWNARAHNDANVITFGSRAIGIEVAKRLVRIFLNTQFEGGRHASRVDKIVDVERRFIASRSG